jgi:hypothetical protein
MNTLKLHGSLVGVNGNAYALMGKFSADAKRAGWGKEQIAAVLARAKSGDYDNLVSALDEQYDGEASR